MTVWRLEREMPASELTEWIALFRIEAREREEADMARRAQAGMNERLNRRGR